jgi:tRNA(fMet)-specific endonuclease VapC
MILDSTFLVDFEREKKRRRQGAASAFLKVHPDVQFCITFTIIGELAAGKSLGADRAKWAQYVQLFRILESSQEIGWAFGSTYRLLQSQGKLIGANDLWIAATCLAHDLAIVTRNARDFERVPKLKVISY